MRSMEINPRPKEVISGNFQNGGAVIVPDLHRAMARLTGVSNVEVFDTSFSKVAAMRLSTRWPLSSSCERSAEAFWTSRIRSQKTDKVVVLADLDELSRNALFHTENSYCSTAEQVLRVADLTRIHRLKMLAKHLTVPSRYGWRQWKLEFL